MVDGALSTYSSGSQPGLADLLAPHLRVYSYDRRGRGESGDTSPYAVAREIEDIDALIGEAGGAASLYGSTHPVRPSHWKPPPPSANASQSSPCTRHPTTTTPRAQRAWASTSSN